MKGGGWVCYFDVLRMGGDCARLCDSSDVVCS